jgi:tetratricopeptide (TPR) repeat protein
VDTQTRHALKKDKFAQAAAQSASWVGEHRSGVLRWVIIGAVVVALVVGGLIAWTVRTSAANVALGAAMDIYNAPLTVPGQPAMPGDYPTSAARATAANSKFVAVADQYGWLQQGQMARYFAGITYQEMGKNEQAETDLKAVASSWNRNLANLGKVALANLYHQTSRDNQAIDLYNQVIAKPSTTVPATVAQLDLAGLYASQGKQDEARALWAKVQDADKQGAAGAIAAQKLAAK